MSSLDFDRFSALTFDCYGTLIHWERGILDAIRPLLERHGVEATDDTILETYASIEPKHQSPPYLRYRFILRLVMTELSLRLGFDAKPDELDYLSRSIKDWKPFPDTVAALEKLKTRYKLGIISNIDDDLFEASAKHLQVPFDWVTTAQQAEAYKPSHRPFVLAFEKMGLRREKILHVAQSLYHDIAPARALGVACVWVNRRRGEKGSGATHPAAVEPDMEVGSLAELVERMGL